MEMPPIEHATTSDGVRVAYVRYPGTSPVHFSVNTPGTQPIALRATMSGLVGYRQRFLRGKGSIYFDWRGTGDSGPIAAEPTIDDLVADIEAVLSKIGEPVDANFVGRACFAGCLHAAQRP